jgi:hypothetical protein
MAGDNELEKKFNEDLDRILSGKKAEPGAETGDDYRTALEFARRVSGLGAEPSPVFKAQLKERLLRRLEEKEARQGFLETFKDFFLQRTWQAVAATIAVRAIVGGVTWGLGVFKTQPSPLVTVPSQPPAAVPAPTVALAPKPPAPATAAAPAPAPSPTRPTAVPAATPAPAPKAMMAMPLVATGRTDKISYSAGETVTIEVTLRNVTNDPFQVESYPPIVSVMEDGTRQPVRTFLSGTAVRTIDPNSTASFMVVWDQRDDNGNPVSKGSYYLELESINPRTQSMPVEFSTPVRWSIR